jgi:hypothetical protein
MKYVSIDIETSGLDHKKHKVLSISAIIEDTTKKLSFDEIPKFNAVVLHMEIVGSPRAIDMNRYLIGTIGQFLDARFDDQSRDMIEETTGFKFYEESDVVKQFYSFLKENGLGEDVLNNNQTKPITINVAGKNFGTFDKLFLQELPLWQKLIRTRQRVIDPAIMFCDWTKDDRLPSLDECKQRSGIGGIVTHNSIEDAWDVILLLRKFY